MEANTQPVDPKSFEFPNIGPEAEAMRRFVNSRMDWSGVEPEKKSPWGFQA